jgi:hypothetical protein
MTHAQLQTGCFDINARSTSNSSAGEMRNAKLVNAVSISEGCAVTCLHTGKRFGLLCRRQTSRRQIMRQNELCEKQYSSEKDALELKAFKEASSS